MEQIVINIIDTHNFYPTVEKYTGLGDPVLSYSGGESLFTTIMSSKFNFSILNETAEDGKFLDLLTGEERRFLIEVREVVNNEPQEVIWQGFLLPDVYSEPYKNGSFFVGFTATDGLDVLKTRPFLYYKTNNVIEYIVKCLWETGLHQQIYFAPGVENALYNWSSIQLFEEVFSKYNDSTEQYQYDSCYDVLDKILKAVGATVVQHQAKWFITGFNRKHLLTDQYKIYTAYGSPLQTHTVNKLLKEVVFSQGLNVSMVPPFRTVQLNVNYDTTDKSVDFSKYLENESLTSEEYQERFLNNTLHQIEPFNKWQSNGASSVSVMPSDGGVYLQLGIDTPGGMHPPEAYPIYYRKPPFCVTMAKVYGPPHSFENDYIELKSNETIFISPQVEGKDLEFDVEMEIKIFRNNLSQDLFNNDFYSRAIRVDLMLGDEVVFTTRSEHPKYDSGDTKLTFHAKDLGPLYHWYIFPDYLTPAYTLNRYEIPAYLKAEVKRTGIKSAAFGKLNLRVYIPKNGDNTFGFNDHHVSDVTITKLDIKVKSWGNEEYRLSRNIRYTTSYKTDLPFGDGKNDLYLNLFKINDRNDYLVGASYFTLFSGAAIDDGLYYILPVSGLYGDYVNSRYTTLRLHSGSQSVLAYKVFGKLGVDSGIELISVGLRVSKARIDEFPHIRDLLNNIDKVTVSQYLASGSVFDQDVPRDKYITWKRAGSAQTGRYLETYAKMIHECTATTGVRLEGYAKDIITPLDIVRFTFLEQDKNFVPTSVSIDFTKGETRLTLTEDVHQNVIDYANNT